MANKTEIANLRKTIAELVQGNEEWERMVAEKDMKIRELEEELERDKERVEALNRALEEKEVKLAERAEEEVGEEATRDAAPDVAIQLANKDILIENLRETIRNLENTNNTMRRVEAENKELELKNAGLKHQRNLMNVSLSLVHMDLEEVRTKVHHDLIIIKDAKESLEEKNKRYEQLAVKYEELRKEGMLKKKKEGGGKVDEDRIYASLVGVLQEATVELEEKEVKEIEGGMEGVDEIKRIIEDSLASMAADKAVRGVNFRGTEEKIDVRLEIRRTERGYVLVGADLGQSIEEPERKIPRKSPNVFSDSE